LQRFSVQAEALPFKAIFHRIPSLRATLSVPHDCCQEKNMQDDLVVAEGGAPLSQVARFVDTLVAPKKTFADILRSTNCLLPIIVMILLTIGWSYSIDKTVGFAAASEVQMAKSPSTEEAMQQLPPDQRASRMALTTKITRGTTYASFIFVLIFMAIETLVLWGSFNFGLGAKTTFSQVFAVVVYAGIPRYLIWILSSIMLFAGVGRDNFDMRNPVGTNLGFFLTDSAQWMKTAGQFFDLLGFWSLALLVIGMAIVARKTIAQSATVVIGWWVLILLIVTGISAAF
jgi:hypothetical protein